MKKHLVFCLITLVFGLFCPLVSSNSELDFLSQLRENWKVADESWANNPDDYCSWNGIKCDQDGRVQVINFEHVTIVDNPNMSIELGWPVLERLQTLVLGKKNFFGTLPLDIWNLRTLVTLDISNNSGLRIPIPELIDLPLLANLRMGKTRPIQNDRVLQLLEYLPKLVQFSAPDCGLRGKLPERYPEKLLRLELPRNRLEGIIPPKLFAQMVDLLEFIDLRNNSITLCAPHVTSFDRDPGSIQCWLQNQYTTTCETCLERYKPCNVSYRTCTPDCVGRAPGPEFLCMSGIWVSNTPLEPLVAPTVWEGQVLTLSDVLVTEGGSLELQDAQFEGSVKVISNAAIKIKGDALISGDFEVQSGSQLLLSGLNFAATAPKINITNCISFNGSLEIFLSTSELDSAQKTSRAIAVLESGCSLEEPPISVRTDQNECRNVTASSDVRDTRTGRSSLMVLFSVQPTTSCPPPNNKSKTWWIATVASISAVALLAAIIVAVKFGYTKHQNAKGKRAYHTERSTNHA